MEAGYDELDT